MTPGLAAVRAPAELSEPYGNGSAAIATGPVLEGRACTKRTLLLVSHAMERAFDAADQDVSGLVVGQFQRREYFDREAAAYAALAASRHTVIVGFTGPTADLPAGVQAVAFDQDDPRARDLGARPGPR